MLVLIGVYYFSSMRRPFVDGWRKARKDQESGTAREVWITSYPVMVQSGVECFLWTMGGVVCGWFGTIQLASYQVVNTISQLAFMSYLGMGVATSIRVANFTGVDDFNQVRRIASAGFHLNIILATVFSIIYFVTFRPLVHFFTPDEAVVIQALPLVFPLILYQYCDSTQITFGNALRGTSKVKPLLWISLGCYLAIGIPCMLFMATVLDLGNVGVYYSFSVALLAAAVALFITFRRTVDKMQFSH